MADETGNIKSYFFISQFDTAVGSKFFGALPVTYIVVC